MPPFANPGQPPSPFGQQPQMPPQQYDPIAQLQQQVVTLAQGIKQIEANQQQMVEHINKWVAKIQGIDSVAFAALALHDGKPFVLDEAKTTAIHESIQAVLEEMGRYRDEKAAEAKAKQDATTTPAAPIRLLKPRGPKDGKLYVPESVHKARAAKKAEEEKDAKPGNGNKAK